MTETIPQMRARHRQEIRAAVAEQAARRITQTEASKALGISLQRLNGLVIGQGIFWPVKRQGRPRIGKDPLP